MDIPSSMNAVVIDGYGGPEVLRLAQVDVPSADKGEVLVAVDYAAVGVWDTKERSGDMAEQMPAEAKAFPRVVGGDGVGRIAAMGEGVTGFAIGDLVYGSAFGSPKGGFYAEFVAVPAEQVAHVPEGVDEVHAAALTIPSATALRGLTDTLKVKAGDHIAVFGAAGSVGLPAVQLASALGAVVFAVASGEAGVDAARRAGAHTVVNGKTVDVGAAVKEFAPDGLDGILATVNGDGLDALAGSLRSYGVLAYPNGVQPEPEATGDGVAKAFNGDIDRALLDKLNDLVGADYQITLSDRFPLAEAADAQRLLEKHTAGRPILVVKG